VSQSRTLSQIDFFLPRGRFLWFSKHFWLLKCLLQSLQGTRVSATIHGGLWWQSLQIWSHKCVVTTTTFITSLTHVPFSERSDQIVYHMIIFFCHQVEDWFFWARPLDLRTLSNHTSVHYRPRFCISRENTVESFPAQKFPYRETDTRLSLAVCGRTLDVHSDLFYTNRNSGLCSNGQGR
jgi:hypothetical protein